MATAGMAAAAMTATMTATMTMGDSNRRQHRNCQD